MYRELLQNMMTLKVHNLHKIVLLLASIAFIPLLNGNAQSGSTDDNPLSVMDPFVGKVYKALVSKADTSAPVYDVSKWEWTLGGKAIRITHSVGDGAYAGETLMTYDQRAGTIVYFYATTGGFYSRGQLRVQDNIFKTTEVVTGSRDGILGVQATGILMDDGSLHMLTSMRTRAGWGEQDTTIYVPAPDAQVIYREIE